MLSKRNGAFIPFKQTKYYYFCFFKLRKIKWTLKYLSIKFMYTQTKNSVPVSNPSKYPHSWNKKKMKEKTSLAFLLHSSLPKRIIFYSFLLIFHLITLCQKEGKSSCISIWLLYLVIPFQFHPKQLRTQK